MHDLVRDPALVAERNHGRALRVEQLAPHALVRQRPLLDRAVVAVVEARAEAVAPERRTAPRSRWAVSSRTASSSTSSSSRAIAASAA